MFKYGSRMMVMVVAVLVGLPPVMDPPAQTAPQKTPQQKQVVPTPSQSAK